MIIATCRSCTRVTGHKRAIGWGTFFAVLVTGGLWLLAIPFYPSRCVICGARAVEDESEGAAAECQSRALDVTALAGLAFFILLIIAVAWISGPR